MEVQNTAESQALQLTRVFQSEHPKLINYVRKWLKDAGERDAEDIIQDVMLSVYDNLDPAMPIGNILAYIYRSIKNRIVDYYRKIKEKPVYFEDALDEMGGNTLADILADTRYDTHSEAEKKEIFDRIFKAVDHLKPEQKAIWIATEIENYSFDELSVFWQKPIGTLLAQKHRAVLALREELTDLKKEHFD